MAVPGFQSFFKPFLDFAEDGKEPSMKEAREIIARRMSISQKDLREMLPSGTQTKFDNRVAWAKSYFVQANALESPRQGYFRITEQGKALSQKGYDRIDVKILNQFPELLNFTRPAPDVARCQLCRDPNFAAIRKKLSPRPGTRRGKTRASA